MTSDAEKTVFISYRRKVSSFVARAIFLDLKAHGYDVFMDVEDIGAGTFDTIILNQIAARAHFLVILTPGSVERCADPEDWLRNEIEFAIDLGRNIVPVFARDFKFSDHKQHLTGKLSQLPRYNGLNVPHDFFDAAMENLRTRFLKQPVTGPIRPTPPDEKVEVARKIEEVASQPPPTEKQLTAEEYLDRGNTEYFERNYERAIADYKEAIRLNPEYAWAYYNRGKAHYQQGNLDGAINDYTEAIRLDPQLAFAYTNRGITRRQQGDLDGAIDDYTKAIRLDPQYGLAYYNRGIARRQQDDLDGAITDYSETIRLDPQYAKAYYNRGNVHYYNGDLHSAIDDWTAGIHVDPQFLYAYNNRGEVYFALGQYEQALSDFRKAIQLEPANEREKLQVLAGLAVTLHALGRVEEARERWQSLLDKDERYRNADWVGKELNWRPELIEEARKLIAKL